MTDLFFWICSRDDNIGVLLPDKVDIANGEIFADNVTSVVTPDVEIDLDYKIFLNNQAYFVSCQVRPSLKKLSKRAIQA